MDEAILTGLACVIVLLLTLFSGIYIAIGMGLVAVIAVYVLQLSPTLIIFAPLNIAGSFVLTAIPLFIYMGNILGYGGVSTGIYRGAGKLLSWIPGGLLHANIGSCALFAAISGSSVATAATIGTMAIPILKEEGYDTEISLGSLAAGGTLGILIPPSITMIIYGQIGGVSVGRLFAGGVVPGILMVILFMSYVIISVLRNPKLVPPRKAVYSFRVFLSGLVDLIPIIALMIIVLGGIFTGFVSPTESAALGAFGAMVIALLKRKLTWQGLGDSLLESVCTSSMILFILIGATMLGSVFARTGMTVALVNFVLSLNVPAIVILLFVVLMYLALGCIMEGLAMVVLTVPIILPPLIAIGVDPVWFGVVLVVLVELGLLTPPVGVNVFVIQGIAHVKASIVFRGIVPFFFAMLIGLGFMIVFPILVLWLPGLLYGS